jgi:hypothetical protein
MSKVLPYLWYPVLFSAAIAGFAALRASDVDLLLLRWSLSTQSVLIGGHAKLMCLLTLSTCWSRRL